MATNKTLSPTNVTIAIPAMGDQPDASVFSNCIDKEADAINTLNSHIENFSKNNGSLKNIDDLDFNTAKTTGMFFVSGGSNMPTASQYGYLTVMARNSNYVKQTWQTYSSTDEYVRICNNGTWGAWISNGKSGYNMSSWFSSLEDSDNSGYMWAIGDMRIITFQGKRRTHAEDEVLFTLPAEHRPSMTVRCAGSYNGTSVVVSINTDGTGVLFVANGQTATGRIYFSVAFCH